MRQPWKVLLIKASRKRFQPCQFDHDKNIIYRYREQIDLADFF